MQAMADQMAQQGRFGDSMMVHMNPIEVAGIASLSPTGQLTTNPMTGQPEAFLPFLAPLLGSLAGSTLLTGSTLGGILGTGLSSAAAGAIGSGLATTALTGDIKQGLVSGLTGFGIGKALGSASQALDPAVTEAAAKTAATKAVAAETVGNVAKTGAQSIVGGGTREAAIQAAKDAATQGTRDIAAAQVAEQSARAAAEKGLGQAFLDQPGKFAMEAGKNLLSPGVAAPIAIGEGQRAAMAAQDERDRMFGRRAAEKEEELERMAGIRDASIRQVGSDYGIDYSREYGTRYAAQGGITSVDPDDFQRRMMELQMMGREPIQMNVGGPSNPDVMIRPFPGIMTGSPAGGFGAPAGRQSRIRGPEVIKPEDLVGTRPGFQPEISYFRAPTRDEAASSLEKITGVNTSVVPINPDLYQGIGAVGKGGVSGARTLPAKIQEAMDVLNRKSVSTRKRKAAQATVDAYEKEQDSNRDYFDAVMDATYDTEYGMQGGGETEMTQQDAMRLIEQVSMALLGRLPEEESEAVINRFIDEFGSEAFQMLRSQVLESIVPDSQKEGVIRGQGGGMDDEIPGMIGDSQPVAVSPGEFIVPADVVSGIGDGDTNAGVQELEGMMDRVRQERTGTTKQPAPLGAMAGGALPA
tara:strand:+ start:2247 stop:4160 length:1914 start_codon:yes stop_codon:yes gene_type:complete